MHNTFNMYPTQNKHNILADNSIQLSTVLSLGKKKFGACQ
jgi:hypothetical protein